MLTSSNRPILWHMTVGQPPQGDQDAVCSCVDAPAAGHGAEGHAWRHSSGFIPYPMMDDAHQGPTISARSIWPLRLEGTLLPTTPAYSTHDLVDPVLRLSAGTWSRRTA